LHNETAEGAERYHTRNLKRMGCQNQAYGKDSNPGSSRSDQLEASGYHSRQRQFEKNNCDSKNKVPTEAVISGPNSGR